MNQCHKCGAGLYQISGPRYEKDLFGREALRYTCRRCGYYRMEPTIDKGSPDDHGFQIGKDRFGKDRF